MHRWIGAVAFTCSSMMACTAWAQFYPGGMGSAFIGAPPVSKPEPLPLSTETAGPRKRRAAKQSRAQRSTAVRVQRNR
jgi:hypothetical protein